MKAFSTLILLVSSIPLFSQGQDSSFLKFDIDKYETLKEAGQDYYFLEDSTKIKLGLSNGEYYLQLSPHNSHYLFGYLYFKNTLTLKRSLHFFQNNLIGIQRIYNESGVLLNELNMDSAFSFSLQELQQKLINEQDIDIMDKKLGISVSLLAHFNPIYNIAYPINKNPHGIWKYMSFDGITGEKIADSEKAYQCRSGASQGN